MRHAIRPAALTALLLALAPAAQALSIDGNLADWGLHQTGSASDWTPIAGTHYVVADQDGNNNAFLSPGYGGQKYDVEALYLRYDSDNLYLALVTGHNPKTNQNPGANQYARGDFAIDFGQDGSWDFGVLTDTRGSLTAGSVVATGNGDWKVGLWAGPNVLAAPGASPYVTAVQSGTLVGEAELAISNSATGNMGTLGGSHWFYELEIPVAVFGGLWNADGPTEAFNVQWTMLCANDIMTLGATPPSPAAGTVPEPATLALVGLGLTALQVRRRRA